MLTKKKIVVVGGTSGIGLAVATRAIGSGAEVVVASRTQERLAAAAHQLGSRAQVETLDATSEESISAFLSQVGSFDHLAMTIKPAIPTGAFLENNIGAAQAAFDAKFWGQYRLARQCAPHIRPNGSIAFTSGIASRRIYPGYSAVSVVNSAVEALSKALAVELAPIRVNCVCPGFVDTEPTNLERANHVRALAPNLPADRLAHANEIADAYLFLFESSYSTGSVVVVDGGAIC